MSANAMTSKYPVIDLREILELTDSFLSAVGMVLNVVLLYLIIKRTNVKLKEYRLILFQNCIIDIFYNGTIILTKAQTEYKDGNFFLIMTSSYGYIPIPLNNFLICSWSFALYFCVTTLPVQFVYRYFLIVKGIKLTWKQYSLMLMVSLILALLHVSYTLYTLWPMEISHYEKEKLLKDDPFYFRDDRPNFITADIRNWQLTGLFSYCFILISASYIIVIWASYKVWKHVDQMKANMSVQLRDVHQQMTKTLIIQALIPLVVCFFPISMALIMVFSHASIPGVGIGVSLLWSWIPVANPLMTIIVVKSYRKSVIKWLGCCRRSRNGAQSATVAVSSYVR